ncbi:IS3 family transposase [Hymenobacter arizonensis]|uniref:Transposase InsO and inactivated derivatives n=1 Tax=Hymenobacter arizonensis TaxID=1227077 RepID=A0A1I6A0C6_HYMAR|nr:IS3 family transposase [Hymenobacter arizonensis]SFQ62156.1 Transposase InsO and inactivated derivatives [Hymenobacter arizonensis]
MSIYRYIVQCQAHVHVRRLCQVLQVAPSAYYAWRRQQGHLAPELAWQVAVRQAFARHSQRYGTRRLRAEVQAQGHAVGRWRIRRVLKAHGLRAQQPRSFVPRTTDSDSAVRAAPNRLLGQPAPTAPNRVWVGDITYLPRQGGGWLYLAVWLDRCSRKIVGWELRDTMPEDLVSEALRRALVVRQPRAGLVVHSDQGSQYTATRFKALVAKHGAQQSMSRRGNCYDNAHAESFWSRFKAESLAGGSFPGLAEAKLEISHHIA